MQANHETIFQSIFVQARGSLPRELTKYLRTKCMARTPRFRAETRGRIIGMVHVRERTELAGRLDRRVGVEADYQASKNSLGAMWLTCCGVFIGQTSVRALMWPHGAA